MTVLTVQHSRGVCAVESVPTRQPTAGQACRGGVARGAARLGSGVRLVMQGLAMQGLATAH